MMRFARSASLMALLMVLALTVSACFGGGPAPTSGPTLGVADDSSAPSLASITVTKTDINGQPLAGATFVLYGDDGDRLFNPNIDPLAVEPIVTDANGQALFANLSTGTYWVVEQTPPTGYAKANPVLVDLAANTVVPISDGTLAAASSPSPTDVASPSPSASDTVSPSPSTGPTPSLTPAPSSAPTARPTSRPTARPTARPTSRPTARPTPRPSARPTPIPTPRPTVPGAPTALAASVNGAGSAALHWSAPAKSGGAAISSYTVGYKLASAGSYSTKTASGTSVSVSGLAAGQTYDFEVAAHNSVGTGTYSAVVALRIGPAAPAITSTPPASGYVTTASFSFTGSGSFECALDASAYAACTSPKAYSGLSIASHAFHVKVLDSFGNASEVTSFSWVVTKPPAPGAVSGLAVTMTSTKGRTTLSWNPGANATGYQLFYDCAGGPNPDQNWFTIPTGTSGGKRTYTIASTKGATAPGARCLFRVRTIGIAAGAYSAYVEVQARVPSNW